MLVKRLYKGSDAATLEKIDVIVAKFESHLSDFIAYDNSLNATFLNNWKNARPTASTTTDDSTEVVEGAILREQALKALHNCQSKYKEIKYFAGKAFPGNKEVLREFGEGQYSKLRQLPLRMVLFMETLGGVVEKYKTQLLAADLKQSAIDEIVPFTEALRNENKGQQLKKKERPSDTRQRIEALNTYYSYAQLVCKAAQYIYRDDATMRHIFRLGVRRGQRKKKKEPPTP